MSQLAAVKVFEIPELSVLVIDPLEKSDLAACALVQRTWHKTVLPFPYRTFLIGDRYRLFSPSFNEANWDRFRKHTTHIRLLEISSRAKRDLSLFDFNCTHLTDLHLHLRLSANTSDNAHWSLGLLKLISNSPGISTLRLNDIEYQLVVLALLRYMPGLKRLVLIGPSMGQSSVDEIMRCAYRLEALEVTMGRIDKDPTPRTTRPPIGFDPASHLADLSLKDHDADVVTADEPCILDSQGRRCRQESSLKKFRLTLDNMRNASDIPLGD
ncbi:hypothetical protein BGZ67_000922 [Mortierella alpina]|nr:hypothetical protein BGZ67_000922 [Mortierella alpina]